MLPRKNAKTSSTLQSSAIEQKAWFQLWQKFSQKLSITTVRNILPRMSETSLEEELRERSERLAKWKLRLNFELSLIRSNLFLPLHFIFWIRLIQSTTQHCVRPCSNFYGLVRHVPTFPSRKIGHGWYVNSLKRQFFYSN